MSYTIKKEDDLYDASVKLLDQLFASTSKAKPSGDSILNDLGIIIFSCVYNHHFGNKKSKTTLEQHIEVFEEELNNYSVENPAKQTLATGYLSFGLVYQFLKRYSVMDEAPYFEENLDEIALSALQFQLDIGNLDYLYGATGILHYILKYTKNTKAVNAAITQYLNYLNKTKVNLKDGITWEDYYFRQRENKLGINLGLAHGVPGVLKLLTLIHKQTTNSDIKNDTKNLINGVSIFLKNVVFKEKDIAFSYFYIPDTLQDASHLNTRLGWCYGDLSNAIALYQTGAEIEDSSIINFSNELIDKTLTRKLQNTTKVVDAGLCHGTSGIFHMYNLLYSYTDKIELNEISQFWLKETIDFCNTLIKDGIYKKFNPIDKIYETDYGFLEGASGIGLSLITLLTGDRYWDEFLLLND